MFVDPCIIVRFIKKNPKRCNNVSKFYYSIFIWSSTCFGRHTAHHPTKYFLHSKFPELKFSSYFSPLPCVLYALTISTLFIWLCWQCLVRNVYLSPDFSTLCLSDILSIVTDTLIASLEPFDEIWNEICTQLGLEEVCRMNSSCGALNVA